MLLLQKTLDITIHGMFMNVLSHVEPPTCHSRSASKGFCDFNFVLVSSALKIHDNINHHFPGKIMGFLDVLESNV